MVLSCAAYWEGHTFWKNKILQTRKKVSCINFTSPPTAQAPYRLPILQICLMLTTSSHGMDTPIRLSGRIFIDEYVVDKGSCVRCNGWSNLWKLPMWYFN